MRIKEIATLIGAGIVSLAAVMILESETSPGPLASDNTDTPDTTEFEDTSSLIEYSMPAPTAEPPAETEEGKSKDDRLFVSVGGSDPVPAPVDAEGNPLKTDFTEPAPEVSGIDETPIAELGTDKLTENTIPPSENTNLAGIEQEDAKSEGALSEDFISAVAAATEKSGPATTPTAADGTAPANLIEETPDGFWLRQAKLNDVFQHLAQLGNYQYFHNTELEGPTFVVTGQLMSDDPVKQMEELSLMYGVTIHKQGNTVYALTAPQLSQLPSEPFRYQLKYLRPKDIDQIKLILAPFLTPGTGVIEFETKTNTLIVMDNSRKLDALAIFLDQIDQPKQQIAIETRIIRITSNSRNRIGVDWSSILGDGLGINASTSLNSLFNLPELDTVTRVLTSTGSGSSLAVVNSSREFTADSSRESTQNEAGLVLAPLQMTAVLRALNAGGLAQQESSPTLITEDNEEGLISIIDRIPIITATIAQTDAGQNITEVVRYKIDDSDPTGDPSLTREVGVSVSVTPTILPDSTIRMELRPRSAQVVEFVEGANGNRYPRVNESTVTTTARVPNGHSLLIGGFYEEVQSDVTNKVPFLGDLPAVNLLFKSTDKQKEHTSLVFIVTPKLYRPEITSESDILSHEVHDSHVLPTNHDYPDSNHPGHTYRSDLRNTMKNSFKQYEPDAPSNLLNPGHPYNNPQALPVHGKDYDSDPVFAESPTVTVSPASQSKKNGGLLGKIFGGNKQNKVR
jgi:type II secretory pathway component GspD/PulD (secretin)